MTTDTRAGAGAAVEAALDELQELVRADGVVLRLAGWDGATASVAVELAGVECLDCVLPPDALREVIEARLRPNLPAGATVEVHDERETGDAGGPEGVLPAAAPRTIRVLDPTARPEGGDPDPGPDAGAIAGRTIGFRVDILWRSWDWIAEEWSAWASGEDARTTAFRHVQGLAGPEGAAHHTAFAEFLTGLDVAVVGLGNCGSCTSWTIKDAVAAADAGCSTVAVVTSEFESLGRTLAAQYGRPNLRFLVLPYPLDTRPEGEVRELARARIDELVDVLGITR